MVAPNAACGFARASRSPRGAADGWDIAIGGETDALFDLASVTKPMFAVAFASSGLDRTASLGSRLPIARGTPAEDAPFELLFAHRAGFPAHLPLFAPLVEGVTVEVNAALESACRTRSGAMPAAPLYSDVGYLLAGVATDADALVDTHIVGRLGLERSLGSARALEARGVDLAVLAPPTEHVGWRGGAVRGRVHDENAWAIGGAATCGHAGLFGTVSAVLRFATLVMDNLNELDWLIREREGGTLRAGFDGKSERGSSAGTVLGPRSFGHLGFTGTSVWIDPDARIAVALLTNRVCPTRDNVKIREARPRIHDELARLALRQP